MLQYHFLILEELTCNFLYIFYFLLNLILDLLMMHWGPSRGLLRVLTVPQDLAQPPKFLGWIPDSFRWVLSHFISLLPVLLNCVKTPLVEYLHVACRTCFGSWIRSRRDPWTFKGLWSPSAQLKPVLPVRRVIRGNCVNRVNHVNPSQPVEFTVWLRVTRRRDSSRQQSL